MGNHERTIGKVDSQTGLTGALPDALQKDPLVKAANDGLTATPVEVVVTLRTLAPNGSPIEQTAAAMRLASQLHTARTEKPRPGR